MDNILLYYGMDRNTKDKRRQTLPGHKPWSLSLSKSNEFQKSFLAAESRPSNVMGC